MKKKQNIAIFERLWLASIAIGVVLSFFDDKPAIPFLDPLTMFYLQLFAAASNLWLVLLVSRKNSKGSFYLLLISFIAGAAFDVPGLIDMSIRGLPWVLSITQYLLQIVGIYYLLVGKNAKPSRSMDLANADSKLLDCALGLLESGKYTAAITLFNGIIESDPGNIDAYCGRGICFMRTGEKEKGLADINFAALNGNISALELLRKQ